MKRASWPLTLILLGLVAAMAAAPAFLEMRGPSAAWLLIAAFGLLLITALIGRRGV